MGGRGSFSASHGGMVQSAGGAGQLYVSKKIETRPDIRQLFINELGFRELYGTEEIPVAQLASLAIELKKDEKYMHTLRDNKVSLSVTHKGGVKGAAANYGDGSMMLFVNPNYHTSVSNSRKILQGEIKSGYKTATNNTPTKNFTYTARHEYGHLTQFSITRKTGKSASQIRSEVQSIAKNKYKAKSANPSGYGATDQYEYFSESFASMTGGKPNAHGKALRDWLKQNH